MAYETVGIFSVYRVCRRGKKPYYEVWPDGNPGVSGARKIEPGGMTRSLAERQMRRLVASADARFRSRDEEEP